MRKIRINGEDVAIAFNLATEIAYEEITGKEFDPRNMFVDERPIAKELTNVSIACLIANNPDSAVDTDYVMKRASREETQALLACVMEEMFAWLKIPAMAEQHATHQNEGESDEDDEKNV